MHISLYHRSADVMATWDPSLTDNPGELNALRDLGLGVAIDITAKHPWERKSTYQAKQVTFEDLIVINESNKYRKSKEQVETYTAVQADLESGFRPDATKPIHVTIAADAHRSSSRSKTIDSKTILTRTVAFRARDPASREQNLEDFEKKLNEWLEKQGCSKYDKKTTTRCIIQYLNELGGVTHYVSSITLGATKYHVSLNSTLFTSLSASSGLKAESFVTSTVKTKATSKVFQSKQKQHHIGRVPDGSKEGRIINFRTKAEAVVKCSYTSLANLVSHPTLRKIVERGINEYIDFKKNGIRKLISILTTNHNDYLHLQARCHMTGCMGGKFRGGGAAAESHVTLLTSTIVCTPLYHAILLYLAIPRMTLCALLTGGPYLIATAELLRSKDSSSKEPSRRTRLYWKVAWEAPFTGEKSMFTTIVM